MAKSNVLWLGVLSLVLAFILRPFFYNQLINTDDGELHAARSANYYLALKQGQIPPRWAPNLDNGHGNSVLMFSYQLPYMAIVALHAIANLPFQLAMNMVFVLSVLTGAAGVWMYARQKSLSVIESFFAAFLYTCSPYSLQNVFVRGALGEVVFFAVLPWIFILADSMLKQSFALKKPLLFPLIIVVLTAFLLTHQISLVIALPMIVSYFFLKRMESSKNWHTFWWLHAGIITAVTICLTLWFWLPMIAESQFTVLKSNETVSNFTQEFPSLKQLFIPQLLNSDLFSLRQTITIGYPILLIVGVVLLKFNQLKRNKKTSTLFWLGWFSFGLFLMLSLSIPVWNTFSFLRYMQFPWRMLWLTTFAGTMLFIETWPMVVKNNLHRYIYAGFILILLIFSVFNYARYRGVQQWSDYELLEYFKPASAYNEFQPIWAAYYIEQHPADKVSLRVPNTQLFINGKAITATGSSVTVTSWTGTHMEYSITTLHAIEIIQKTYYFPGWKVWINDQKIDIKYEDRELPGHIMFTVNEGTHRVQATFTNDTPARKVSQMAFFIGLGAFIIYSGIVVLYAARHAQPNQRTD